MQGCKLTTEEFIRRSKEIHGDLYDYSNTRYINYNTKVCITCKKHGDFWQLPANHMRGLGCLKCRVESMTSNNDEFIEKAKKIHGDKYDYSKVNYINGNKKVTIICPKHGEFLQKANNHLHGNGCPLCRNSIKVKTDKQNKYTTETFIEKSKLIHGDLYDYSKVDYKNKFTPVIIICNIHGEFYQRPNDHLIKKSKCPKCAKGVYTQQLFIDKCNEVHNNFYDYSKTIYRTVREKVMITCLEHGDFELLAHSHLAGGGCSKCVLKALTKIFNMLCDRFPNENILFEVNSDQVSWLNRQRLDIYFPKYNIAVEYDGQQHFMPIDTFGGLERFELLQQFDQNKNKLCEKNRCILFRIPYNYTQEFFDNICIQIKNIIQKEEGKS